ncbi:MAG TPA: DUF1109 domain-containing protein [Steroidobacteraceae bacterium]|jgi:hypothetical protein|nr:DUF1109 domain-containing protein [Steroidobacteraceae bacterium]
MQTSDLIDRLATDLRPVPSGAALMRIATGLLVGGVLALVGILLLLGTDLADALFTRAFWMKWGYGLALAGIALWLCLRLARPESAPGKLPFALAIPLVVLAAMAVAELAATPPGERLQVWLGRTSLVCPWLIGSLAIPLFLGVLWAFRKFAPTRPRLAGFSSGALAGALAAVLYSIHCNETAAAFVATWYTIGIALPAVVGLLIGPRVLRW